MAGRIFEIAFQLGAELTGSFRSAINEANRSFREVQAAGEALQSVGKTLSVAVTAPVVGMGTAAFAAAVDFESAFAGVKKTIDTTDEGYAKLEAGIRDMAKTLPASASEIAAVAESAGQLGIAEDNILSFSRTIIDLGESTNMTQEQAATEFARFANIVGMSQNDFDRLGSSIVGLGNSMATTESEIMSMGMRLAGQGAQVGMSESEIMALSATMSSLGIQAEAGGTAMTTILKKIQGATGAGGKELAAFAKAAGMSSAEFKKSFETDAVGALDSLVKGLAVSGAEGKNLTGILETLGIKGIYESDVLLRMSGASDLLSDALETSGGAWEENTALTDEAAQRYQTTAAQLAMLKNKVTDVAITVGTILIPIVLEIVDKAGVWIDKFGELDEQTLKTIMIVAGIAAAVGPVLFAFGTLTKSLVSVMRTMKILKAVLLANPFILVIAAIAALGVAFVKLYQNSETFRKAVQPLLGILKTGFVAGFEQVKGAVMDAIPQVIAIVSEMIPLITNIAMTVLPMLMNVVEQVFPMIVSVISTVIPIAVQIITAVIPVILMIAQKVIPVLLNVVQQVFPMILSIIQSVLPVVANLLKIVIDVVLMLVESVLPLIITVVEAVFPIVLAIMQAIIPIIVGVLGTFIAIIQGVLLPAINAILTVIQFVFPYVQLVIQNTLAVINGIIQTAMALLQGDWSGAWETIKGTAETIMNNIISFFEGINLYEVGKTIITGLINGIKSMGNTVIGAITDMVPAPIRGVVGNIIGKIPGYAEGGIVTSPELAWIGEGGDTETVIPWNNSQRSKDLWLQTGQALGMLNQKGVLGDLQQQVSLQTNGPDASAIQPQHVMTSNNSEGGQIIIDFKPTYQVSNAADLEQVKQHAQGDKDDLFARIAEMKRNEGRLAF